jgi:hypothetical protein
VVRLITWNVARRVQALVAQAALAGRDYGLSDHAALEADVVCG